MTRSRPLLIALAAALLLAGTTLAGAQVRSIPAEAKRGLLRHVQEMTVEINGRAMLLAPGAQVRDQSNLIVVPASLPARALVKYTLDANGNVAQVWILTAQEAAQPDRRK